MFANQLFVGIGASAGGLEALQGLFAAIPPDSGNAFVVITHLAPGRDSALTEILSRATPLPVSEASDGAAVRPDHVYVMPPGALMTIRDGSLRVRRGDAKLLVRHPIDAFLGSLAEHSGEHAVGIILSGSGTDGTLGVKAIKEWGGLTIAQGADHVPPRHTGMPSSAIASGLVDLVLPVEQIAEALAVHRDGLQRLADTGSPERALIAQETAKAATRHTIYGVLRQRIGHDFSGYKETTFLRRVQRRMQVLRMPDLDAYVEHLRQDANEVSVLFRDLLIGVTNFFRDEAAFAALEQLVIPRLFDGKGPGDPVRVWVPGCATGEEAYSIAILLREHAEAIGSPAEIKLFASDINEPGLVIARFGHYPGALLDAVSPERRARFFVEDGGTYSVSQTVRDMCIFSAHSLIRDPPFSRIDLVSCRNLLIYLTTDKQGDVIPLFHYALRPGGYLFLGGAENLSHHPELFSSVDKKHRIFQRRDLVSPPARLQPFISGKALSVSSGDAPRAPGVVGRQLRRTVENRVLERFAPPHVVVNGDGDIVHYSTRTGNYLEAPSGQPSRHLLSLARKGLRLDLRSALREAVEMRRPSRRERVPFDLGPYVQLVDISVEPLPDHDTDPLFLVLFVDVGSALDRSTTGTDIARHDSEQGVERLERELRDTHERLQTIIEEHETGVEELKSSNEELVSLNEELQSTNEELETNKEELQSVNEELNALNAELKSSLVQLNQANSDLLNLFDSTQIAVVFLDNHLLIRSFTAPAASLFRLIATDAGRPLTDIAHRLDYGELEQDIRAALTAAHTIERRIARTDGGGHYLARVLPYQGAKGAPDGVIVTLINIDSLIEAERRQESAIALLMARVRQQAAIAQFGKEALRNKAFDELLQQAAILVAEGLEIERSKVLEALPEGDCLLVRAGVGWDPGIVGVATIGADTHSPAGYALKTGEPVVSEDLSRERRFEIPEILRAHGIESTINVIIRGEGEPFGVLEVDSTEPRQFSQDDINFMQSCANLVASALDRLTTETELQQTLEEKQVLLYELQHRVKNSLQQITALVNMERRKIADPEIRHPLEVLGGRLEALSVVYRKLYLVNHHTEVDLGGYLAELAGELFAFHGVDPDLISQDLQLAELRVDLDCALPLGLVACEFIVNSFKHAFPQGTGRIGILLESAGPDAGQLILTDNGVGIDGTGNPTNGSGLTLIKLLAAQVGGELQIESEAGVRMVITFRRGGRKAGRVGAEHGQHE